MFGITSGPEKYQKIVKDVLISCKRIANIADDLIIHGWGIIEHDENLLAVLRRLRERGITLKEKTWQLRLPKLTSFGRDLSSKGIAPSEEKVSAVQNASSPQSIAEIRSSLGLVQYGAKFLPGFPAQNADEKRPTVYVGRRPEEILPLMERSAKTSRNTCLLQEWMRDSHCCWCWSHRHRSCPHIATRWPVESNFLCILTDVERSYSLALVWACRRHSSCMFLVESWRLTISWAELESDHKPLQYIYNESSTLSAGIELWVFRLQGSNFKVIYSPSKTNITDALSRLNYVNQEDYSGKEADLVTVLSQESTPVAMTTKEVERGDNQIKILNCVVSGTTYKVVIGDNAECLITWVWKMNFAYWER